MLRLRVLTLALLPIIAAAPSRAEATKTNPTPSTSAAATPAASAPAAAGSEAKPQTTAAADPASEPAPAAAQPSSAGASATEAAPAKAAEPVKKPQPVAIAATLTVQIDLSRQSMTVSEHGSAKYTWPISSGTSEHPTPRGTFHPQWTAKMWYSKKYDNAPMPNAVFINGGVAIHATPHTRYLGSPASHGCIRLAPTNAATFYRLVHQHGLRATKVSVYGTPKWRAPAVASRRNIEERPRRYAVQEQNNGFFSGLFGGSSYKTTSAYDPGFIQQQRRVRRPVNVYAQGNRPRRIVYRSYDGSRVYYVQRPPRRVYYNKYGYGYGSGY